MIDKKTRYTSKSFTERSCPAYQYKEIRYIRNNNISRIGNEIGRAHV